ncbi:MAG: hypothetical protein JF597_22490 [Streptomyces sp.]|uniref:hypothetical protein n=1 Tax=Streptomyces sp. TaxID=1931 RepID=UPI0025E6CB6C|nr:hypothetical protein [Streptomyces sp.]MBW8796265.1 hypothetical protein [Streptomyces sp.]
MRSFDAALAVSAVFDGLNLMADAGLVPVVRLAERARLVALARESIRIIDADNGGGANPDAEVMSLIAAMCTGADSIEDAGRLRHGAMPTCLGGIRAPSPVGADGRGGHESAVRIISDRLTPVGS